MTDPLDTVRFSAITHGPIMVDPLSGAVSLTIKIEPGDLPPDWWSLPSGTAIAGMIARVPDADEVVAWPTPGQQAVQQAAILRQDRDFQTWCWEHAGCPKGTKTREEFTRQYIYQWCGIRSNAELRTNAAALRQWHDLRTQYYQDRGKTAWIQGPLAAALRIEAAL